MRDTKSAPCHLIVQPPPATGWYATVAVRGEYDSVEIVAACGVTRREGKIVPETACMDTITYRTGAVTCEACKKTKQYSFMTLREFGELIDI